LVKKFFPFDKNYLLEQAQQQVEDELLTLLVKQVTARYESRINPLGILDSFSSKIRNYQPADLNPLHDFYEKLAAIYRYKFGNNQLEFLWDGTDHFQHYQKVWRETFEQWINNFCQHDLFIQAVLDLTVFLPKGDSTQMLESRMHHFIQKHMDVKFHKTKGIMVA
jgi:hypothetical protein